jgi:hypothetical protein
VNFPVAELYSKVWASLEQSASPSWKKPLATESWVVEAKPVAVSPENDEVPEEETTVPVVVTPMKLAFPPVRFPPFKVRYVKDAPFPVVDPMMFSVPVAFSVPMEEVPMVAEGPVMEPVIFPVTFPVSVPVRLVALTFDALMFPACTLFAERLPVKVLVAVPVTFNPPDVVVPFATRFVVVAVPETTRSVVEAEVVAVKMPTVKEPRFKEMVFATFWRFPANESGAWKSLPAEARPTAPAAFVLRIPEPSPAMARLVVVAPREMMAFVDEESVRTERMELVLFPVMMTSEGKVYVPAPKVPPVVVMTPVPLVYEMTEAPESEEEEILLLKLVQSAEVRQPKVPLFAVLQMS